MVRITGMREPLITGGKAGTLWVRTRISRAPAPNAVVLMCLMMISDGKIRPFTEIGVDSLRLLGYL
jgi:hypothetical protein